jgi:glycerophosphoryl diester phosphodiesterase
VSNPWRERRVVAFAHQGGSFEGPSSTLFAIERALAHGASAIELDVHATKDGRLVVCHDETVDATTNHRGAIAELTLAEIERMDNAYWWIPGATVTRDRAQGDYPYRSRAPEDRDFAVVTLEEVAARFPGVALNLDIKRTAPEVRGYEQLLANELVGLGIQDSVIVASFHDRAIEAFRAAAPGVATAGATGETALFYFSLGEGSGPVVPPVQALQVPATYDGAVVVDERFVEAAHAADVAVHVWTINDVVEMARLLDLGVDGIVSDTPTPLGALLKERNCAWNGVL